MAFTLQIRQKKLFGKTVLDIPSLAQACGFCYGSNNDFYILQENEQANGTAVFYHPEHIGRGIFFDGSGASKPSPVNWARRLWMQEQQWSGGCWRFPLTAPISLWSRIRLRKATQQDFGKSTSLPSCWRVFMSCCMWRRGA